MRPRTGCATTVRPGRALLKLTDGGRRLAWRWNDGGAVVAGAFGDPIGDASSAYDVVSSTQSMRRLRLRRRSCVVVRHAGDCASAVVGVSRLRTASSPIGARRRTRRGCRRASAPSGRGPAVPVNPVRGFDLARRPRAVRRRRSGRSGAGAGRGVAGVPEAVHSAADLRWNDGPPVPGRLGLDARQRVARERGLAAVAATATAETTGPMNAAPTRPVTASGNGMTVFRNMITPSAMIA